MGLAAMLRKASPVIDMVTGNSQSTNLDLIRRMAQSKIKRVPTIITPDVEIQGAPSGMMPPQDPQDPNAPPIDPGMTPPQRDPLNPDAGFTVPKPSEMLPGALMYRPDDAMTAAAPGVDVPGKVLPYPNAPDMSNVDPAKVESILARMRPDPLAPVESNMNVMGSEPSLLPMEQISRMRRMEVPEQPSQGVSGLLYDEGGRPLKPQYLDPRSEGARKGRDEYISALETYKPVNRNSRGKSILISGGRAALAGLQHGPAGALGGFLTGAIGGGINPAFDEEYAKRRDLAEAHGERREDYKYRKAESDLLGDQTDREYKRAMGERALNPQYAPKVVTSANGDLLSIEDGVATPIINPTTNTPFKGRVNSKQQWRNDPFSGKAELWEITPGETDKKIVGAVDVKRDLVKSAQGWVPPVGALQASATAENRDFNRDRQTTQDAQRANERQEDKGIRTDERTQARREKAAGIVARLEAARQQWISYDAQAKQQPSYKAHFEGLRDKAGAEAAGAATELSTGYSDFYEAGMGEGGLAYYKEKPGATPALQPPRSTGAGKPGKIQPGEDPEVRDYANNYFKGDYQKALEAIRNQKR